MYNHNGSFSKSPRSKWTSKNNDVDNKFYFRPRMEDNFHHSAFLQSIKKGQKIQEPPLYFKQYLPHFHETSKLYTSKSKNLSYIALNQQKSRSQNNVTRNGNKLIVKESKHKLLKELLSVISEPSSRVIIPEKRTVSTMAVREEVIKVDTGTDAYNIIEVDQSEKEKSIKEESSDTSNESFNKALKSLMFQEELLREVKRKVPTPPPIDFEVEDHHSQPVTTGVQVDIWKTENIPTILEICGTSNDALEGGTDLTSRYLDRVKDEDKIPVKLVAEKVQSNDTIEERNESKLSVLSKHCRLDNFVPPKYLGEPFLSPPQLLYNLKNNLPYMPDQKSFSKLNEFSKVIKADDSNVKDNASENTIKFSDLYVNYDRQGKKLERKSSGNQNQKELAILSNSNVCEDNPPRHASNKFLNVRNKILEKSSLIFDKRARQIKMAEYCHMDSLTSGEHLTEPCVNYDIKSNPPETIISEAVYKISSPALKHHYEFEILKPSSNLNNLSENYESGEKVKKKGNYKNICDIEHRLAKLHKNCDRVIREEKIRNSILHQESQTCNKCNLRIHSNLGIPEGDNRRDDNYLENYVAHKNPENYRITKSLIKCFESKIEENKTNSYEDQQHLWRKEERYIENRNMSHKLRTKCAETQTNTLPQLGNLYSYKRHGRIFNNTFYRQRSPLKSVSEEEIVPPKTSAIAESRSQFVCKKNLLYSHNNDHSACSHKQSEKGRYISHCSSDKSPSTYRYYY